VAVDLGSAETFGDVLRLHTAATPNRPFLVFEDAQLTWAETYRTACRYANLFLARRRPDRPFHVGILLENRPEFVLAELGAALAGAIMVGLNPTRRGAHLARDVVHSDCQLVITEGKFAAALGATLEGTATTDVLVASRFDETPAPSAGSLETALAAVAEDDPRVRVGGDDLCLLVFTSGTTDAPRAVMRSHIRLLRMAQGGAALVTGCAPDDAVYCAMPLFHANAQILGLGVALAGGARLVLARRFHKSRFLADVRRYGCTLFNYVGSPLAYIMDTPARPDDADNPLRLAYGNEGPRRYLDDFARRFGCRVIDSYGASEVGVVFTRQDGDPPGALGLPTPGVAILDARGDECPPARFDAAGRLVNPEQAIGEIVNTAGAGMFEGYYKNDAATATRTRGGMFHTGDLGYRDDRGYVYFAGRDVEWIRVEGENFLARPIEEILQRHPDVFLAAVYGVPDAEAGDRVMAALVLRAGSWFDGTAFAAFLDAQPDLSSKWAPTYVRIVRDLVRSETNKVQKRHLQSEKFIVAADDAVFWRPRGETTYRPFTPADLAAVRERFRSSGNAARID